MRFCLQKSVWRIVALVDKSAKLDEVKDRDSSFCAEMFDVADKA